MHSDDRDADPILLHYLILPFLGACGFTTQDLITVLTLADAIKALQLILCNVGVWKVDIHGQDTHILRSGAASHACAAELEETRRKAAVTNWLEKDGSRKKEREQEMENCSR